MSFRPEVNDELVIEGIAYRVAEHPSAPGMPYGQEGRQAVVYRLASSPDASERRALKVFKPRYRVPALVGISKRLGTFSELPGLQVCRRLVLTPRNHDRLINEHPDLLYAALMPWIDGPTWLEIMLGGSEMEPSRCLLIARSFVEALAEMEQEGLAHCDLSGPNVLLAEPGGPSGKSAPFPVALVDVEQMYGLDLKRPELLPAGSSGYAHGTAPKGLWQAEADRFAGAILATEMLGWCEPAVRAASWGENYFDPGEMQQPCERYEILHTALGRRWGPGVADLFEQAWKSETLAECPSFGTWVLALPGTTSMEATAGAAVPKEKAAPSKEQSAAPVPGQTASQVQAPLPAPPDRQPQATTYGPGPAQPQVTALEVPGAQQSGPPPVAQPVPPTRHSPWDDTIPAGPPLVPSQPAPTRPMYSGPATPPSSPGGLRLLLPAAPNRSRRGLYLATAGVVAVALLIAAVFLLPGALSHSTTSSNGDIGATTQAQAGTPRSTLGLSIAPSPTRAAQEEALPASKTPELAASPTGLLQSQPPATSAPSAGAATPQPVGSTGGATAADAPGTSDFKFIPRPPNSHIKEWCITDPCPDTVAAFAGDAPVLDNDQDVVYGTASGKTFDVDNLLRGYIDTLAKAGWTQGNTVSDPPAKGQEFFPPPTLKAQVQKAAVFFQASGGSTGDPDTCIIAVVRANDVGTPPDLSLFAGH